jgi:hypothetical protein
MEPKLTVINNGDIVVSIAPYGKFSVGTLLRAYNVSPMHRTDSWGNRGALTHYSFVGKYADGSSSGYSTLKSVNFRLATPDEINQFNRGSKNVMSNNNAFAIENDSPVFVQEIEDVADGSGNVETKHVGEPKYFSTGKAAKVFVETEIQNAVYERKFPKYAMFRYHSTAQAKKPEVEYERTNF